MKSKSTERSAEEYGERMEAQKVEICIEAQIREAGEEEEARARATETRRMMGLGGLPLVVDPTVDTYVEYD